MRWTGAGALVVMLGAAVPAAWAGTYPDHAVRLVVPTAPAGSIDATARALGETLSKRWGQPVIVDNRPGANMIIGTEVVAKAPPDGYTLLLSGAGPMAMNVAAMPDLPYDARRDFAPVAMISSLPYVLIVNDKVAARSARDLIALSKREPGKLNYASGGPAAQMAFALLKQMAGVDIVDVAYKGASLAVESVIAGPSCAWRTPRRRGSIRRGSGSWP